ncbi:MAG: putative lipid II flippase FtsW [Candidatus Komeilibacteria bacterium]|nr:putative lipid II flippase FtsW [Candidatus Komeilibacteria bacterium]
MRKKINILGWLKNIAVSPFTYAREHHQPDFILIGALGMIIVFGLMMLSSASSVEAYQKFGDSYYFFKHQLTNGFLPGLVAFFIAAQFDYRNYRKLAFWAMLGSVGLLLLVLIPGIGFSYGKEAQSWINLGLFSFQPTEVVKLAFLIYLAAWLEKKGEHAVKDFQYGFLPFIFSLGLIVMLVMAQPDLGTLLIIVAISLIVYFVAGGAGKHIAMVILGGLLLVFIAVQIAPYRMGRLTAFFNPGIDQQGIGYHINQAKIAVGSGGILGLGIGKSRQKFNYLPEVYGDSIFAIIAEEMGFIFCIILLLLYLTVGIRGFKISRASPDDFGKFLSLGIASWICVQAFINISTMIGLFPLTGIPLPFISYGGTSLVVLFFAAGILVNISKQTRKI